MEIVTCIPCQFGHHEDHQPVVEAAFEGVLGGAECHCKGECRAPRHEGDREGSSEDDVLDLALAEADRLYDLWQGAQKAIDRVWGEIPFGSESEVGLDEEVRSLVAKVKKSERRAEGRGQGDPGDGSY